MFGNDEEHDSDYEEADEEMFNSTFKPSYIVVAIDTHPLMFQKGENEIIPFRMCLEACVNLADKLLFKKDSRSWSPFAIVLAGVDTPLVHFSKSILESIKLLKTKSQLSDADLKIEFERKGNLDLSAFFLNCKKVFHDVKSVFYKRKLIYVSNDDKPVSDKNSKFTALNEIKTFSASQIQFLIVPTVQTFNYELFYNELFTILGGIKLDVICTDTEELTQELSSSVLVNVNESKLLFFPFKFDNSRHLKCLRRKIFWSVQLNNNFMTKDGQKVVNTILPADGDSEHFRIKSVGIKEKGQNIMFDAVERDALNDYTTPRGFTLSYVADRQVGIGHIFKKPYLIRKDPKEELPYFNKFWDNCVASNKVLVCISKLKQPDQIRYVELIPVLVDGIPMFLEKRLPFGNEIVPPLLWEYPEEETDEKRKLAVQLLVDKLTFDFDPKMLQDIPLQKKKAYIKAKLLDEPPEPVDDVQLDHEALDDVLDEVVANINEKFDLLGMQKKRKGTSKDGSIPKKGK